MLSLSALIVLGASGFSEETIDGTFGVNRDFEAAELQGARLIGDFTDANLRNADLSSASLAAIF